jgi:hypothetical protein
VVEEQMEAAPLRHLNSSNSLVVPVLWLSNPKVGLMSAWLSLLAMFWTKLLALLETQSNHSHSVVEQLLQQVVQVQLLLHQLLLHQLPHHLSSQRRNPKLELHQWSQKQHQR